MMMEPPVLPPPLPEPRVVEPELVVDPPALDATTFCETLETEERVLGASSEADLWIQQADGSIRVVDPRGEIEEVMPAVLGELGALLPWGQTAATVAIADELWRLGPEGPTFVYVPREARGVRHFCGDPERDANVALVSATGLFDREIGQWFSVGPVEGMNFADIEWLATVDGACHLPSGGLWFGTGEDLWRVDGTSLAHYNAPGATGPALVGAAFGVAVPAGDRLLFAPEAGPWGTDWSVVEFAAGDIAAAGAGGDALWVSAGSPAKLFRYDGAWREASHPGGPVHEILPDARGGAWLRLDEEVCHVGTRHVGVRGMRPYENFRRPTAAIRIEGVAPTSRVELRVEDVVTPATGDGSSWSIDALPLGDAGWHSLEVLVDGEVARTLVYRVVASDVSWETDVRPIYETHCASSACHGADSSDALPLSTFDAWVDNAREIKARISDGTMPRDASAGWTATVATRVIDWTEGLQP